MPSSLVKARWNGPFDAQLGAGHILKSGEEHEVTPDDLLSEHWVAVGSEAKKLEKAREQEEKAQAEAATGEGES